MCQNHANVIEYLEKYIFSKIHSKTFIFSKLFFILSHTGKHNKDLKYPALYH